MENQIENLAVETLFATALSCTEREPKYLNKFTEISLLANSFVFSLICQLYCPSWSRTAKPNSAEWQTFISYINYIVVCKPQYSSFKYRNILYRLLFQLFLLYSSMNILHETRKLKANWIGHILRRNCLLQRVTEGKIQGGIEVIGRQGRRRRKLLDDLNP